MSSAPSGASGGAAEELDVVLADLGLALADVRASGAGPPHRVSGASSGVIELAAGAPLAARAGEVLAFADGAVGERGALIVVCAGSRGDVELAALRDALWPAWHVGARYDLGPSDTVCTTLAERRSLGRGAGRSGTVLVARRAALALAPETTVAKFDRNARGWNRGAGEAGERHFRWMRRHVARFAERPDARRILDFGSGAGWVGIEAALLVPRERAPFLAAFDPSPEMVRLASENARAAGIARFEGRTGFGEEPPFPRAGEEPFDLVLSSGVISFAADVERWLDGLVAALAPGGTLVIGDVHPGSAHMRERRRTRPLLPLRELNARTREDVRARLEARGLEFEAWSGYQLSRALPQLRHLSERRLGGVLDRLLVAWEERASAREIASGSQTPDRFDSWVLRMRRRA